MTRFKPPGHWRLPALAAILLMLHLPATWAVTKVRVAGLFMNKAVVEIDGKQYILEAGGSSPEGVKLISADAHSAVMVVDGEQRTFTLGHDISSHYTAADSRRTTVTIWPDTHGMYRTVGSIDGFTVKFLVDTGATLIAMNSNQARRLGIDYRVDGSPSFASTASGVVKTWLIRLKKVKVGGIELTDVRGSVIEGDHPAEVLLGMSFLGQLELLRDGRTMELKTRGY